MSNKKRFDPFSNAKLTLQGHPTLKIGEKMVIMKNWMEAGILTLNQLTNNEDKFNCQVTELLF